MTIRKKVCLVGAPGAGKTSLVRRFVHSDFREDFLTTLGVKIDKSIVRVEGKEIEFVLWDIAGSKKFSTLECQYLDGCHGYLNVADGTNTSSIEAMINIQKRIQPTLGAVPFICVLNKADLEDGWAFSSDQETTFDSFGWLHRKTSAKTGDGVSDVFQQLGIAMLSQ